MKTQMATVIALSTDRATLSLPRDACAGCGKRCGIGALATKNQPVILTLPADPGLKLGDQVALGYSEQDVLRVALLGYLLPAAMLVSGALSGHIFLSSDLAAAIGALIGLTFGLWLARRQSRRLPFPELTSPCLGE